MTRLWIAEAVSRLLILIFVAGTSVFFMALATILAAVSRRVRGSVVEI